MTKDQKVTQVSSIVHDARRFYTKAEFAQMVDRIWDGLDRAKEIALETNVTVNPQVL